MPGIRVCCSNAGFWSDAIFGLLSTGRSYFVGWLGDIAVQCDARSGFQLIKRNNIHLVIQIHVWGPVDWLRVCELHESLGTEWFCYENRFSEVRINIRKKTIFNNPFISCIFVCRKSFSHRKYCSRRQKQWYFLRSKDYWWPHFRFTWQKTIWWREPPLF